MFVIVGLIVTNRGDGRWVCSGLIFVSAFTQAATVDEAENCHIITGDNDNSH